MKASCVPSRRLHQHYIMLLHTALMQFDAPLSSRSILRVLAVIVFDIDIILINKVLVGTGMCLTTNTKVSNFYKVFQK